MTPTEEKHILIPHTDIRLTMVKVVGGSFLMGGEDYEREKPIHPVHIDTFWIGKYPVTQGQWHAVVTQATAQGIPHELNPTPAYFANMGKAYPVEEVSWIDCSAFCSLLYALLEKAGEASLSFHLPTEAQWEYAAKGGTYTSPYKYAGSDNLHQVAWYADNAYMTTQPVGFKIPNALGLYDMSGNVWEWCLDAYRETAYAETPAGFENPVWIDDALQVGDLANLLKFSKIKNRANFNHGILRGGSWSFNDDDCRVANRNYVTPDFRHDLNGCRLSAGS